MGLPYPFLTLQITLCPAFLSPYPTFSKANFQQLVSESLQNEMHSNFMAFYCFIFFYVSSFPNIHSKPKQLLYSFSKCDNKGPVKFTALS